MMRSMRRVASSLFLAPCLLAQAALADPVAASRPPEPEETRVARILQAVLEKHGGEVNRCFEQALADTLDVAGRVELSVDVGENGKVESATPVEQEKVSPVLLACLQQTSQAWIIPGLEAGSTVVVPLLFAVQANQFSVKAADAPEHGPPVPKGHGGKTTPPFTVKVLVDEANMHAKQASLSLLTVGPASRIALHKHPGAEILFVRKGRLRVLGPQGTPPEVLTEGGAVFIPGGMPHAVENMVRTAPVETIEIFVPAGPERVYRDPKDEKGRAAFDVIRDLKKAVMPAGVKFTVATPDKAPALTTGGGKIHVKLLFDAESTGSDAAGVSLVEFDPGADIPRHTHPSAEVLYIFAGQGELTIGSDKLPFGPDQAIHLPEGQPHAAKFTGPDKTVALQIYAPAGPEQRYKAPATPSPSSPAAAPKKK